MSVQRFITSAYNWRCTNAVFMWKTVYRHFFEPTKFLFHHMPLRCHRFLCVKVGKTGLECFRDLCTIYFIYGNCIDSNRFQDRWALSVDKVSQLAKWTFWTQTFLLYWNKQTKTAKKHVSYRWLFSTHKFQSSRSNRCRLTRSPMRWSLNKYEVFCNFETRSIA